MANTRRGFITGGTWCVDLNKMIDFWPPEDSIAEIREIDLKGGGSGSNLAIDIKKIDPAMPVETIGIVGDDENGRFLLSHADSFGIDRRQMAVTKELPTQFTDCFGSRRTGRRTHIYYPGAAALLTPDHFQFAETSGRIFHLGLPGIHRLLDAPWQGDANGWVTILKKAKAAGLTTNFELVMIEPQRLAGIIRPCLPYLDYLVVNDWEIGALADERTYEEGITNIAACLKAARHVLTLGSMTLVVVHFPKGAIAVARDGAVTRRPSVRVPQSAIVGANGAGDAFAAGMLYGLHEGWEVERCLSLAHASAAASLRGASTTGTVESWQTCLQLAEDWGWNEWPAQ
jgi:sugar/nucleoside kinase (ribokinase family)